MRRAVGTPASSGKAGAEPVPSQGRGAPQSGEHALLDGAGGDGGGGAGHSGRGRVHRGPTAALTA